MLLLDILPIKNLKLISAEPKTYAIQSSHPIILLILSEKVIRKTRILWWVNFLLLVTLRLVFGIPFICKYQKTICVGRKLNFSSKLFCNDRFVFFIQGVLSSSSNNACVVEVLNLLPDSNMNNIFILNIECYIRTFMNCCLNALTKG